MYPAQTRKNKNQREEMMNIRKIIEDNILLITDSYKVNHKEQYPAQTEFVYSYFSSRGGLYDDVCFFGLQYTIMRYLAGQVVTEEKIEQAKTLISRHIPSVPFDEAKWRYILDKHDGRLPVSIRAVAEGTVVSGKNVLFTICNTDPECFWLTNYLETLLVQVWYPTTVCTSSREMKKVISQYLHETGTDSTDFKLHDFGYRGSTSVESAAIGGAAHLVNFRGTDTLAALIFADVYYGEKSAGFSIPASEHSTITSWGRDHEADAMANMLKQYPVGLVACVSDSFNIFNACENIWGTLLKDEILERNGTLIIRPDSGDPLEVIPKILEILGSKFPVTINDKGYKVLHPHVRIIQGDGVDINSLEAILEKMKENGWSADNIAFGSGGGLLQKFNRDTLKFAMKCSSTTRNGVEKDVYKDPITDEGKTSRRGRMSLIRKPDGTYVTVVGENVEGDLLKEVFRNGELLITTTFEEIRKRAEVSN